MLGMLGVLGITLLAGSLHAQTIRYSYDDAGRLIQVDTPAGAAQYRYEAAGNLIDVLRPASSGLALTGFSPAAGPAGTPVTITGSGFAAIPGANAVAFNGIAATVTGATPTTLLVTVPAGAASGQVSVTVGGETAWATQAFSVTGSAAGIAPTVTGISPRVAAPGDTITVTGVNFMPSAAAASVRINGLTATVSSQSATSLTFSVPAGASTGPVLVSTANGSSAPTTVLFIAPGGALASSIGTAEVITVDGAVAPNIQVAPGKTALLYFAGSAGARLQLGLVNIVSTGSLVLDAYKPDGALLTSCGTYVASGGNCNLAPLPVTGGYQLVFKMLAAADQAGLSVVLSSDFTDTLVADGVAKTFATGRAGQNAWFSFTGLAGQALSLQWSGVTFAGGPSQFSVLKPDGSLLAATTFTGSVTSPGAGLIYLPFLSSSGSYTVFVDPYGVSTGRVTLQLASNATVTVDAPPTPFSLSASQRGILRFSATAGQRLRLAISALSTVPAGATVSVIVRDPDGRRLATCNAISSDSNCSLLDLSTTGSYFIEVVPAAGASASMSLALAQELAAALVLDGAVLPVRLLANQQGRITFSGTLGQRPGLGISALATSPAGSTVDIQVLSPDGSLLVDCGASGSSGGGCALPALPASGTYAVITTAPLAAAANLTLTLSTPVERGALIVNGASTSYTPARAGQSARYTFAAAAGDYVSFAWTGQASVVWIAPDGSEVNNLRTAPGSSGRDWEYRMIPVGGTYSLLLGPGDANLAPLGMQLKSRVFAPIIIDGPSLAVSLSVGQSGEFSFTAPSNGNLGLGVSPLSITPVGGVINFLVLGPTPGNYVPCSVTSPGGSCYLSALVAGGKYRILITPYFGAAANLTLTLSSDFKAEMIVNGPWQVFDTNRIGKRASFTFRGRQGGTNLMDWSGSTFPSSSVITVLRPNGVSLNAPYVGYAISIPNATIPLPLLPETGDYVVFIDPRDTSTGRISVRIRGDVAPPLPVPDQGDIPIPPWALVVLAGMLAASMLRRKRRA